MDTVTIVTAETSLSELIDRAEAGEEIILTRGDTPVAKTVPYHASEVRKPRVPGALKGKVWLGPEFFEPLPDDELALWCQ